MPDVPPNKPPRPLHPETDLEKGFLHPDDYEGFISNGMIYDVRPQPALVDPAKATKFTPELKDTYVRLLARYGNPEQAADACGVCRTTVQNHRASDKAFDERVLQAELSFKGRVRATVYEMALEGEWEPQFGRVGKDQDGVVGYVKRKNWDALKMVARAQMPEFRENNPGAVGVTPGVLVVYPILPEAEWERQTEGELLPKDPLAGIPGAEGLLLEDKTPRRGPPPTEED